MRHILTLFVVFLSTAFSLAAREVPVQKTCPNGLQIVTLKLDNVQGALSLRLLFKTPAKNEFLFSLDEEICDPTSIQKFITYAAKKLPAKCKEIVPSEIAVVAVGDFDAHEVIEHMANELGSISLKIQKEDNQPIVWEHIPGLQGIAIHLSYLPSIPPLEMKEDLEAAWANLILDQLCQKRQALYAQEHHFSWVVPVIERAVLPAKGYIWADTKSVRDVQTLLMNIDLELSRMRTEGVSEEEVEEIKNEFLQILHAFNDHRQDPKMSTAFLCEQIFSGWYWLSDESFLAHSFSIVKNLNAEELKECVRDFFSSENRHAAILLHSENPIAPAAFYVASEDLSFQKVQSSALENYLSLPMTLDQKEDTYDIVHALGTKNKAQLLANAFSLNRKGKHIKHVHPMRFIGYIISDAHLKDCLRKVKEDKFKWHRFIREFSDSMNHQNHKNALYPYLDGFAEFLHISTHLLMPYFERHDWEGLTIFLMHH